VSYESIKTNVKICMFDQYGTVVDMQGGLTAIATPFLQKKGWKGDPNSFVTWWRRTHFENSMIDALLHREHTPYREIGHRSVAHVMDREALGAVETRAAHGADIGKSLVNLDNAAAAPGCRRVVAEQFEILGFFGNFDGHRIFTPQYGSLGRLAASTARDPTMALV